MSRKAIRHLYAYPSPLLLFTYFLFATSVLSWARAREEVVQFINGDRSTCEIIKLEKGYLYVKLDYVDGTVAMDWSKVARIESSQGFVVADKDGRRYTGTLHTLAQEHGKGGVQFQISGASGGTVENKDVVAIGRTDTSFLQNLHGEVDLGVTYSKQESRTQYNFQSNGLFQRTKWAAAADYESSFSGGGDISNLRNDLRLRGTRQLRSPKFFYAGLAGFLQSDEQQLALRTTLGGAVGYIFRNTNSNFITAYAGTVWNRERYSPTATTGRTGNSAEAVLGTQLNLFRFKTANLFADARAYPSLTDSGRARFDLNTSVKLRIIKNLYWRFGYYLNFDSRPPQSLPRTDYGSTSSLGWSF